MGGKAELQMYKEQLLDAERRLESAADEIHSLKRKLLDKSKQWTRLREENRLLVEDLGRAEEAGGMEDGAGMTSRRNSLGSLARVRKTVELAIFVGIVIKKNVIGPALS